MLSIDFDSNDQRSTKNKKAKSTKKKQRKEKKHQKNTKHKMLRETHKQIWRIFIFRLNWTV